MFTSGEFEEYATSMRIKLLNSSPYYAQANSQAEASNKGIIKLIKRKIEECPRHWHIALNEAIWAYRMAWHGSTNLLINWYMDTKLYCLGNWDPNQGT